MLGILVGCNSSNETKEKNSKEQTTPTTDAEYVEQATFTDLEGNEVAVSDYKGKVVMIDFWETWCKPCLASFPTLQKLEEKYPDRFVVFAVTPGFTDTRDDAQSFANEHEYDFTYLMDSNKLHQKLGVQGIPFKVFVDGQGNFIKKSMGSYGPDKDYKMVQNIIKEHSEMPSEPEKSK
ncbi:TlpA family protein disulfide reductase [Fodinibius halophilus]|uniref:TlpA family protein disulfide reductase n=1 Tax=Fodinibius halophilus TaxID=1736908 RepID=UPI00197A8A72|nr:TlpA disulfide reductase family protein [Fodinibius halophilus]